MSEFLSRLGFVLEDLGPQTQWAELVRHAIRELESQEDQIATLATQRDACMAMCQRTLRYITGNDAPEDWGIPFTPQLRGVVALCEQEKPNA